MTPIIWIVCEQDCIISIVDVREVGASHINSEVAGTEQQYPVDSTAE
jgi:hypothetical protein